MSADEVESVKELRYQTGSSLLECKKVLRQCGGDTERALEKLRDSGSDPDEPEPEVQE